MAGATVSRSRDVNAYTFERSDVNMDIVISDLVPDRLVNFLSYAIAEINLNASGAFCLESYVFLVTNLILLDIGGILSR